MPIDELVTVSPLPTDGRVTIDLRPVPQEVMPLQAGDVARERSIEFARGFTEEQARREAHRCLRCDLSYRCPTINVIPSERVKYAQTTHP
jgi:hypothetical protein